MENNKKVYYVECTEGDWEDRVNYVVDHSAYYDREDAENLRIRLEQMSNIENIEKSLPFQDEAKEKFDIEWSEFNMDAPDCVDEDDEDDNGDAFVKLFCTKYGYDFSKVKKQLDLVEQMENVMYYNPMYFVRELELK